MKKFKLNINTKKNLLAFSGGVDSTALFFILLEHNIPFDIAIVDYNQRTQSKDEVIYATQLAHKYSKKCYISTYPSNYKFTEKDAREFRYNFFDEIILQHKYDALVTAHQLNDTLEWFLMQFTKGAGLTELLSIKQQSQRKNYILLKPLLDYTKQELQQYLEVNNYKYFIDDTNFDTKYKRNYFRHHFSDKLLEQYKDGIKNSFHYLTKDYNSLFENIKEIRIKELVIYENFLDFNIAIRLIDKELKKRGIIISSKTREEILTKQEIVVSHKISVSLNSTKIYIAPFVKVTLSKKLKEKYRVKKIPPNIRGYITQQNIEI